MLEVNLQKTLGDFSFQMSFTVEDGEILVVVGASGCGKSTLLNLISGVLDPEKGRVSFTPKSSDKARIYADTTEGISLALFQRHIGYIQQKSNLFPQLTVLENIRYGLKEKPISKENHARIEELSCIFELEDQLEKYPSQLSGGQQQRVSIVRAVMTKPDILLFDEPFSALDNLLRESLRRQLLVLKELLCVPILFVTHDLEEAYALADRVLYAQNGHIIEIAPKTQLFHRPKKRRTAEFVGVENLLPARFLREEGGRLLFLAGELQLLVAKPSDWTRFANALPEKISLGIRPSQILFVKENQEISTELACNLFQAIILEETSFCESCRLKIKLEESKQELKMRLSYETKEKYHLQPGKQILVSLRAEQLLILEE